MADIIEVRTLGDFAVLWGGRTVLDRTAADRRATVLFKALLRRPGFRCSAESLADEFWPDSAGKAARTNVRVRLHELRAVFRRTMAQDDLPEPIRLESGMLFIDSVYGPVVDAIEFEREALALLDHGASNAEFAGKAAALLQSYGGEYLEGDRDEQTVSIRERLARLHRALLLRFARALSGNGKAAAALDILSDAFERYAYDEAIAEEFVIRLTLLGRRDRAREVFSAHARALFRATALRPSQRIRAVVFNDAGAVEASRLPERNSLVGRAREREFLESLARDAMAGRGCAVSVTGAQGVGKSRLLAEVLRAARARGTAIGLVRCYRAPSAGMASNPVAGAVERLLRSMLESASRQGDGVSSRELLENAAAEFFERSAEMAGRGEIYELFFRTLDTIVAGRPSILAIDDADLDERAFSASAARLVGSTGHLPLLWIFVQRCAPLPAGRKRAWLRDLELLPLPLADCRAILERYFGGPVGAHMASRLANLWPGDIAVMLAAAERARPYCSSAAGEAWEMAAEISAESFLPETLAATIARRMESLGAPDLDVLKAMTFLDSDFSPPTVARLLKGDEAEVERALERLVKANLVLYDGESLVLPGAVATIVRSAIAESRERAFRHRLQRQ